MGIYRKYLLPRLIDSACAIEPAMRQRQKVVPLARGRVLEVGVGSGLNLSFYDPATVTHLWGLEPAAEIWALGRARRRQAPINMEYVDAGAEAIPLGDASADSVVLTYTLCSIERAEVALAEIRRVLKSDGALIFCEHGRAPDEAIRKWQNRLNPLWMRLAGGCHLNRPIPSLLEGAGFLLDSLETMYLPGLKPLTFNYWGTATKRRR